MVIPAELSASVLPTATVAGCLINTPYIARHSRHPIFLTLCLVVVESVSAMEDLDAAIMKLGADDFEEREAASAELGALPAGYARVFLKLASAIDTDPEIKERLVASAKTIFEKKIGALDERWLKLHGSLNISYQPYYVTTQQTNEANRDFLGMAVSWVNKEGACDKHLHKWDVITAIDGIALSNRELDALVKPGCEYELTIRRYASTATLESKAEISSEESYEELKIKVTAGWRAPQNVDHDFSHLLMNKLWKDFLTEFRNPFNPQFAALK